MKFDPGCLLQVPDDPEEVARLRVAARLEHAGQAFGGRFRRLPEFFEAGGRLDIVA